MIFDMWEKTGQNSKGKIDRIYRINRIIAKIYWIKEL